jgi:hypothetical protein
VALDPNIEPFRRLRSSHCSDVAIVDRLLKAALGGTALEPGTAPPRHRLMRHVSVDIDAGDQAATKAEAASDLIVMDFVLRGLCSVEGFDAIGVEYRSGHGSNSSLPQACTAADPPQSFPSDPPLSTQPRPRDGKPSP